MVSIVWLGRRVLVAGGAKKKFFYRTQVRVTFEVFPLRDAAAPRSDRYSPGGPEKNSFCSVGIGIHFGEIWGLKILDTNQQKFLKFLSVLVHRTLCKTVDRYFNDYLRSRRR